MSESNQQDLVQRIKQVLMGDIGPALGLNAEDIDVTVNDDGGVRLRLDKVCDGCPSTIMMLVTSLDQEICRLVPEVKYVEVG